MVTVDLEMNRLKFFGACQLTMCSAKNLYMLFRVKKVKKQTNRNKKRGKVIEKGEENWRNNYLVK